MGVFQNNLMGAAAAAASAGGGDFYSHQIANSMRFAGVQDLDRSRSSAGSTTTSSISFWVKRSKLGAYQYILHAYADGNNYVRMTFLSDDTLEFQGEVGGAMKFELETTQVFRDTSAWYHIVGILDFTNGTQGNRAQLYVNGERVTAFDTETYPADASQTNVLCGANTIRYGDDSTNSYILYSYLAEIVLIDGTAQAVGDFGETKNGVWIPKDPSGLTFGTTGHYLKFESSSDLGNDSSGNNNDFTPYESTAAHDQMLDTPTFGSSNGGNFMTYNGAMVGSNNALAEGNLKSTGSSGGSTSGTFGMLTGKWYWECRAETVNSYGPTFGIGQFGAAGTDGQYYIITWQTAAGQMYGGGGYPDQMGTITVTSTGVTSLSSGDILSFWLDCDNGKLWIGKNGTIPNSGDPASGSNPQASWSTIPTDRYFNATCQNVGSGVGVLNAGQNPSFNGGLTGGDVGTATDKNGYGLFKYDPSSTDFIACCAANLSLADAINPSETDDNYPQKLFGATIWTGDGTTGRAITGLGFQPDWLWFKARDSAFSHRLYDTTRGIGSTGGKRLFSNTTGAQVDQTSGQDISAVGTDGFTLGASSNLYTNDTNNDAGHVNFAWRANGGTTSTNSNGSTNSTVQVDPSGHFSIVTFEGQNDSWGNAETIGHGLSSAPNCMILKNYDKADEWSVFFSNYGGATIGGSNAASNSVVLNSTSAVYTNQSYKGWGGVMPTSTLFTVDGNNNNGASESIIVYCFANCEGYIKSGTYRGNGSADGTFVYTGLKPAWLMIKQVDSTSNWNIFDTTRDPYNYTSKHVAADSSAIEYDGAAYSLDILSNGFKMVSTWGQINGSGNHYVYLAMAHNPFKYATAR
jgi:hypothetical protein